jgi:hypothetical protein
MDHIDVYYVEEELQQDVRSQINAMSLGEKDSLLQNVEAQIEAKRAMLLKKQRHLENASKQNEFLGMVKNDYQRYYDYIVGQKRDQIKAMHLLKNYVDDLIVTGKMTDTDMQNAKQDQQNLEQEVGKIKKGLDEIISGGSAPRTPPSFAMG